MSGDCDLCGSYDHVETRCPTVRPDPLPVIRPEWHRGCDRRIAYLEAALEDRTAELIRVMTERDDLLAAQGIEHRGSDAT